MSDPQGLPEGAQIVAGPERVGSEQRWRVRLADGRAALLARLAPELARDLAGDTVGDTAGERGDR